MDFIKSKTFPYIIAISAGAVAFSAAFFSVFGLSKLFAGAQASVVIMAGSLEFAKLVTASFLYSQVIQILQLLILYQAKQEMVLLEVHIMI